MTEKEWVKLISKYLSPISDQDSKLRFEIGFKLPYGHEIKEVKETNQKKITKSESEIMYYETDLILLEDFPDGSWKPRLVIEAKLGSINTHDAITYSHKAYTHKSVFPYLRYGVMLGNRGTYPLPGRLYRHGEHFDFMISFADCNLTKSELQSFLEVIREEVSTSRNLEKIIYESRQKNRDKYTLLHRKLKLKKI